MNPIRALRGDQNKFVRIWMAICMTLIVLFVVAVYFAVSEHTNAENTKKAAATAQRAIDCTNTVLSKRAATTAADNKANVEFHAAFTADSKAFGLLLTDILTSAPSSKSTPDFLAYIKVHNQLIAVSASTARTLQADQEYRDQHPIGAC